MTMTMTMINSAYKWGARHHSCHEALGQRLALGPKATQADWYAVCPRGDWLIWQLRKQLRKLPKDRRRLVTSALLRAMERLAARAIRRARKGLRGIRRATWATKWRRWARYWLSGKDRSLTATIEVAATAWTAVAVIEAWVAAGVIQTTAVEIAAASTAASAVTAARDVAMGGARATAAVGAALTVAVTAARAATAEMGEAAVEAAVAAAEVRELRQQAHDIRAEIPTWPGD